MAKSRGLKTIGSKNKRQLVTSRPAEPGCESVTGERVEARATVRAIRVAINKSYFNRTLYFDDYLIISLSHYLIIAKKVVGDQKT